MRTSELSVATQILNELMPFRRKAGAQNGCGHSYCPSCLAPHLGKVAEAVRRNQPVTFVLPAFPGKSPNPAKVLGPLPDMAERRSLQFFNSLCKRIQRVYKPGAKIVICSDGRVFSDLVGMAEEDVTRYQRAIESIIREQDLTDISTFHLDELSADRTFSELRNYLVERYGTSLAALQETVRKGARESADREAVETNRMYCGLTRFLVEDRHSPSQSRTRASIQKECKAKAYLVMQRSNAWTEYIAERFPEAVRLSIHPQACGSKKLGIQLIGTDSWMTPWHGVAVQMGLDFVLMKRWEAEGLGAQLVRDERGQASHFIFTQSAHVDASRSLR